MLILALLAAAALYCGIVWLLPRLVALIAIGFALVLARRARRSTRALLAVRSAGPSYDCKPSRAARRALRDGLQTALDQTELRSLFPSVLAQVDE